MMRQNEEVKTLSFNLIEKIIFDIVQQGMMDSLLMRSIKHLIRSERFMDALMRLLADASRSSRQPQRR